MATTAASWLFALLIFALKISAIPTISAVGSKFFTSDGDQFYIKGVAYQLIEDDPLIHETQCQLDANLMAELGANTIRVYHVDPSGDHSGCMKAFADKGIYLFVNLDSFHTGISTDGHPSWTQNKLISYQAVMDNFQQYDNTAGFFVGNEVLNVMSDSGAAPYVLAAATDLKAYRDAKGYRKIPVGYSATDTAVLRPMLQDYVVCRPSASERLDFYSLNSYEWCGSQTSYTVSGYNVLQDYAKNYPVPIFLSEDGCNTAPPRDFSDQSVILGPQMDGTWSGAIIYEWIQETNNYGLVSYGGFAGSDVQEGSSVVDGWTRQGTPTPISPDFTNLQAQWKTLSPTGVKETAYAASTSTITPLACPSSTAGGWTVVGTAPLPTLSSARVTPGPGGTSLAISAHNAAGKTNGYPLSVGDGGFWGMLVALASVGAAVFFLL